MGFIFSKLWNKLFHRERQYKLIIVGLQNAGKTAILYKLALGDVIVTQPTIGSNLESFKHKNISFDAWDLGGQEKLRSVWSSYYQGTDAVIFVVDSSDEENTTLSKMELFNVLLHQDIKNIPVLILANKQDLPISKSAAQICEMFTLHSIQNNQWRIQGTCALTGEGLQQGMDWLIQKLLTKSKAPSTQADVTSQSINELPVKETEVK